MRDIAFFIQNNMVEKITIPVARFAREHAYELIDRSSTSEFNVDDCEVDWSAYSWVIPYGSVQFIRKCRKSKALAKYFSPLEDTQTYSALTWREHLRSDMLNWEGELVFADDVAEYIGDRKMHIRPMVIQKAFNGQVIDQASWAALQVERKIEPDTWCFVSQVQDIKAEWRIWMIDNELVAYSKYRENGQMKVERAMPEQVLKFINWLDWIPLPSIVIDVAQTADDQYKVIEFNSIHTSGWYAADVDLVMQKWIDYIQGTL